MFSSVISSDHLSFSFSFFIHGESSVCTAVEIQQRQRIRHLTLEDVAVAATRQDGLPGIGNSLKCTGRCNAMYITRFYLIEGARQNTLKQQK